LKEPPLPNHDPAAALTAADRRFTFYVASTAVWTVLQLQPPQSQDSPTFLAHPNFLLFAAPWNLELETLSLLSH
jgi:hypothetical protein